MDFNTIQQRKPIYPVGPALRDYLREMGRVAELPITYADLRRYDGLLPTMDAQGRSTLWNTVLLRPSETAEIHQRLVETYQMLIAGGRRIGHLAVASIDFCAYGNSQPFRIKILNLLNDNHDYFYVKQADASRIYGLELEHFLSPNRIQYQYQGQTIVEEHIIGVPGDAFIAEPLRYGGAVNNVRLSKEFVKFNERCFTRLLGDMRAYNFVVDVIQDVDQVQYRLRCIDFDQQCYEGRLRIYLPQFYKENMPFVRLAQQVISPETADQYRHEERSLLRKRHALARPEMEHLLETLSADTVSTPAHIAQLAADLAEHHGDKGFRELSDMGAILRHHLALCLEGGD